MSAHETVEQLCRESSAERLGSNVANDDLCLADLPAEEEEPLSYHQAKVKPRKLHTWSDDPEDVEIRLGLPEEVTKREQITVTVSPNSLHVTVIILREEVTLLKATPLVHKIRVKVGECTWFMEKGDLVITLTKLKSGISWGHSIVKEGGTLLLHESATKRGRRKKLKREHAVKRENKEEKAARTREPLPSKEQQEEKMKEDAHLSCHQILSVVVISLFVLCVAITMARPPP